MRRFFLMLISFCMLVFIIVIGAVSCSSDEKLSVVPLTDWSEYSIVRSDTASSVEIDAAVKLRKAIESTLGVTIQLETDWVKRGEETPVGTKEILIGNTNRTESNQEFLYKNFSISFENGRIAINGGSAEAVYAGVEWYVENCINSDGLAYPANKYSFMAEYPLSGVTLGGIPLGEYSISAGNDFADASASLAGWICEMTGKTVNIGTVSNGAVIEFTRSESLSEFGISVKLDDKKLILATNLLNIEKAVELLKESINSRSGDVIDALDQSKTEAPFDIEAGRSAYDSANALAEKRILEIRAAKSDYKPGDGGIIYYVSNHGDNMNKGTTPETAKATVNGIDTLKAGDVVLLERGGLWREAFKTVSGVTYSAYGEGDKPMIYASPENGADESKWKLLEGTDNIWVYATEMMDVGNIIFNEGEVYGYKAVPYYENGQFVVKTGGEAFDVKTGLDRDLKFFSKADSLFTDKTLPVSNTENVGEIYLRCDKGNPGKLYSSIEFLIRRNGIGLAGTNVIIDNLCIKYVGAHGIGSGTVGDVTIRNCELGWIGGGIQFYNIENKSVTRYGNGIEIYGGCDSFTIENCYVYDCYDAGITHQYQKGGTNAITENNVTYLNNVIERCAYNIEYFMGKVDSGNADRVMNNIRIKNNILRFAGKSYGERPHSVHIMGWEHRNEAYDFVIEGNTFIDAENRVFYIGVENADWLPVFKGNTYIQKYSGQFAHYGVNGKCAEIIYNEDIESQLSDKLGETDAKIFFIME